MALAEDKSRWSFIFTNSLNRPEALLKHFSNWEFRLFPKLSFPFPYIHQDISTHLYH